RVGHRALLLPVPTGRARGDRRRRPHDPVPEVRGDREPLPADRPPRDRHDLGEHPGAGPPRLPRSQQSGESHAVSEDSPVKSRVVTWLALGLILVGAAAIRLRLLDLPLDRDEGEYAYFGQLLLEGVPPYAAAYNLKAPGIYVAYALILAVFGHTTTGIHLGLIVVTSATTVLTYLLARRLVGLAAGLVAAAVYAVQALNPKVLGLAAYAEHFVLLFVVAGALVLQTPARDRRPAIVLAAGLLFGVAFLMKQSAAAFVVGGALTMLLSNDPDGTPRWPL